MEAEMQLKIQIILFSWTPFKWHHCQIYTPKAKHSGDIVKQQVEQT